MRRGLAVIVAFVMVAACGGDSAADDETSATANPTTATESSGAEPVDSSVPEGDEASGSGNRARVTIGDLVYDVSGGTAWVCLKSETLIGGNFVVDVNGDPMMAGLGETGVGINFVITSPDSQDPQTPFITVQDVPSGTQWQAGEMQDVPESMLSDVSLVDGVATGSATFFDLAAYLNGEDPELVEGSFEIACP